MRDIKRRHGTLRTPAPVDQSFSGKFRKFGARDALSSAGFSGTEQ
jgi:hypothetical protein